MMKKKLLLIILIILTTVVYGNDGRYLTHGGVIYPIKETKISLKNEFLSFKVIKNIAYVNIKFEFFNPENIERKLLIGFQAPSAFGDVSKTDCENHISNFIIQHNDKIIEYKLKGAECEDCELMELQELDFSQENDNIYVYIFELTFKPGVNKINHSYSFPSSSNIEMDEFYNYILTTGSKWANNKIENLTVHIDLGKNKYFYVADIFEEKATWSIIGNGKISNIKFDYNEDSCKMVRVLSGTLQIQVKDFEPKKNIEFGVINNNSFISRPTDFEKLKKGTVFSLGNLEINNDLIYTKNELKILRNTIYAQYGYKFNSKELNQYFNQFEWYMPNPNLKLNEIKITEKEKIFIKTIKEIESKN